MLECDNLVRSRLDRFIPKREKISIHEFYDLLSQRTKPSAKIEFSGEIKRKTAKVLLKSEMQVLAADGFLNDYYSNLLDCHDESVFGVILNNQPCIYNRRQRVKSSISIECEEGEELTSIKFSSNGNVLGIGTNQGSLKILDLETKATKTFILHYGRIGCLDWKPRSSCVVATGSKDRLVRISDTRQDSKSVLSLASGSGEICGLGWSGNGLDIASGGNDNLVNIWDIRQQNTPKMIINSHKAGVRGLCWAPFQDNILATGGGSGDMKILVHNINKNQLIKEIQTDSQVCGIVWDEQSRAIISSHGFSRFQVSVWDYENDQFSYELLGHSNRVLSLSKAGSDGIFVSGSADKTIRVWNIRKLLNQHEKKSSILSLANIR